MMASERDIDRVLDCLSGSRESFRDAITNIDRLMMAVCDYAEHQAKKKRLPAWSIIGEITSHGSGVSSAIYELYRRKEQRP